jgi:hypothetical protein
MPGGLALSFLLRVQGQTREQVGRFRVLGEFPFIPPLGFCF